MSWASPSRKRGPQQPAWLPRSPGGQLAERQQVPEEGQRLGQNIPRPPGRCSGAYTAEQAGAACTGGSHELQGHGGPVPDAGAQRCILPEWSGGLQHPGRQDLTERLESR